MLLLQVSQTHGASEGDGVCKVELVASGCRYNVSGSVQGGIPVLLELNGSVFRQPIALCGNLLFFKASGGPQLLSSLAGMNHDKLKVGYSLFRNFFFLFKLLHLNRSRLKPQFSCKNLKILHFLGVLTANGVEIQSFSAPTAHPEDPWHCMGVSSLLPDLSVLKPVVKDVAQLQI